MKSYRELTVWQKSFHLTTQVYRLTAELPSHERYGLSSQLQRCAVSIPSNIAEGQQRNGPNEYKHFLSIARGSAAELSTQLLLVKQLFKIDTDKLVTATEEIQKMLYALQTKL